MLQDQSNTPVFTCRQGMRVFSKVYHNKQHILGKFILTTCDMCLVLKVLQTDVVASANAHLDDGATQQQPSVVPPRRPFSSAPKLDEDARRRSEAATQQLMQNYNGPPNAGIRLMSKMGYGVAGRRLQCLIMAPATLWSVSLHAVIAMSKRIPT